jgi:acetolactate synthase-1/2/3 large subunit
MSEQVTGATSLIRPWKRPVDTVFGSRRRDPSRLRPVVRLQQIRHILVRHEQGAGHAAQGYAQVTGRVGVCMATSGPGATTW